MPEKHEYLDREQPALWQRSLAGLYRVGVGGRLRLYRWGWIRSRQLPVRVICVGNLTVGGTGKTPTVMTVVRTLADKGMRPAVLSRGYGGRNKEKVGVVSDGKEVLLGPEAAGDEPCLLAKALPGVPVLVGAGRYDTGLYAVNRFGADVLVMDDGYQHIQLKRDINLLLLDGRNPWSNGHLLPAGRLREPIREAARASAFILNQVEDMNPWVVAELRRLYPDRPIFLAGRQPVRLVELPGGTARNVDHLQDRPVGAFCGLGHPRSFYDTLASVGVNIREFITWPDHHRPTADDWKRIRKKARETGLRDWITTAKDAVKLGDWSLDEREPLKIWVLEIEMEILNNRAAFENLVAGVQGGVHH